MSRLIKSLFLCLLVTAITSHAGDKIWIGTSGAGWNTAGNWDPAGVPGAGDTVIFNSTTNTNSVIDAVFSVGAMRIETGYTATITISTTASLRVNGLSSTAGYSQADGIVDLSAGTAINEFQNTFTLTGGTFKPTNTATENNFNNVLIDGGTFDASNVTGSVSINNFTQTSGASIAKPGLNFGINGSWTFTGGTFNPNGGTISFSPNSPSTINAGGANGAFNNVVYIAENNMTLASTDIVINGTFTQTSLLGGAATFSTNGRNFTVNSGASPILAGVFFADGGIVTFGNVRLAGTSHLINNTPVNGELRAGSGTVNVGDLQFEGSTTATTGVGIWTLGTGTFNISGNYNRTNGGTAFPPVFNRGTNTVNFVQNSGGVQLLNTGTSATPSATDGRFHNITKTGTSALRTGQPLTIINNLTNSGSIETTTGAAITVGGVYQSNSGFIDSTAQASSFNGSTILNGGFVNGVRIANSLTITAPTTTTTGTIELIPTGGAPLPITVAANVTWITNHTITGANYRKEGTGTLELRSINAPVAAAGTNLVNAGSFISELNSSVGGTTIQINSGGTYGGRGTAPAISVASGGILFPGASTSGQLDTTGAVTLTEGAIFRSRIVGTAAADIGKLSTNQAITLGNATLNLQVSGLTPTVGNKYIIIDNTSTNPITGTFAGLPEGGKIGFDSRAFSISYVGGTGNDVELTSIANTSPSITSAASAVPQITNVNQSIAFSVAAADAENSALTYSWNFGDGTTGTGSSVSHAYTTAGTYNAVVTVNDGEFSIASAVSVTVLPINNTTSVVGQGADADGDGFSDAIETAAGTDPANPTSTPTGALANVNNVTPLTIDKAGIKLNFAKTASDSISFAGTLAVPADFVVANQKVVIDAGGVAKALTLSDKGAVKVGGDSFKISIKAKKKVVAAQTSKFSAAFTKGTFSTQLADENLTGTADAKNAAVSVLFTVLFNNTVVQKSQPLKYSAKTGKTGSAK